MDLLLLKSGSKNDDSGGFGLHCYKNACAVCDGERESERHRSFRPHHPMQWHALMKWSRSSAAA